MKIIPKIEQYYPVSDEWYPNYPNNLVRMRVTFYENDDPEKDMVRISFWGADDFGLEKDELVSRKVFYKKIKEIKNWLKNIPEPLSAKWLKEQGFISA
jgi:hypothetical protein